MIYDYYWMHFKPIDGVGLVDVDVVVVVVDCECWHRKLFLSKLSLSAQWTGDVH